MSPSFVLDHVEKAKEWEGKFGPMIDYNVTTTVDGAPMTVCMSKKPTSAPPSEGETVEGELADPAFAGGLRRLKAFPKPPGGPPNGRSAPAGGGQSFGVDSREAAIVRQHGQHMSILFVATMQKEGITLPGDTMAEKLESLRKIFDWMDDDVRQTVRAL